MYQVAVACTVGCLCVIALSALVIKVRQAGPSLLESRMGFRDNMDQDGTDRMELLAKMRGELKARIAKQHTLGSEVKAFVAASEMPPSFKKIVGDEAGGDEGTQELIHRSHAAREKALAVDKNWRSLRSDWKPYDPSKSLQQNLQEHEDSQRPIHSNRRKYIPAGFAKYESDMRHTAVIGGHSACADWGEHPIDCLREAYHNKLAGTKFSSLQRRYDGKVSGQALSRERDRIAKMVASGLVTGQVKPPKHGEVRRWVDEQRRDIKDRQKEAMDDAVEHESAEEKHKIYLRSIAKDWGTAVAQSGPNAGKRFYIDYVHHTTTWDAPDYVRKGLKMIRMSEREKELERATHEAELYKEGFRAAQEAYLSAPKPTAYPSLEVQQQHQIEAAPPAFEFAAQRDETRTGVQADEKVRAEEQAHAQVAIARFLRHAKGSAQPKGADTRVQLHLEREKIARELGVPSLTHTGQGGPEDVQAQAVKAIDRFLKTKGVKARDNAYTRRDLASEREKIAHELGVKSLTHPNELQDQMKSTSGSRQQQLVGMPLPLSQDAPTPKSLVIIDPYGRPITAEPTEQEYPMGDPLFQEHHGGGVEESAGSKVSSSEGQVVKAYEDGVKGEDDKTAVLQSEVNAQAELIKDLRAKVDDVESRVKDQARASQVVEQPSVTQVKPESAISEEKFAAAADQGRDKAEDSEVVAMQGSDKERVWGQDKDESKEARAEMGTNVSFLDGNTKDKKSVSGAKQQTGVQGVDADKMGVSVSDASARKQQEENMKPPLTSYEMAKFANNVEAGQGAMGTNIVHMYKHLSETGPYKQVEEEDMSKRAPEEDNEDDEYKSRGPSNLISLSRAQLSPKVGKLARLERDIEHREKWEDAKFGGGLQHGGPPQQI